MNGVYVSIGVLVAGAVVVLLSSPWIGARGGRATTASLPFAVVALLVGLTQLPAPLSLAVVALSGVAGLAILLLSSLDAEVPTHVAEASALLLLGAAGGIALASATDLLWAVVGLETLALSAVTLVALGRGERCLEAAFKYFVLGALSLASLLYGVGLIFLGTGSLAFPTADQIAASPATLAGTVLVGLGFAFELALFPLQWGAVDAYTAAVPSLAGYVMSASKLGAAFALGRLVLSAGASVAQVLVWLGCLTIIWGTFAALAQGRDLRRMLAYSAITHAGFIGVAVGSGASGPTVAAFYAACYGTMAMLVFAALSAEHGEDVRGMGPLRAVALGLGLFALSGIPPTPGFWAKLAVLVAAWQAVGPIPTLIAALGGVFSVLYYLRPIPDVFAAMRRDDQAAAPRRVAALPGLAIATLAVVAVAIVPGIVWRLALTGA